MSTLSNIDLKESNINNNDDSESIASDESEEIIGKLSKKSLKLF